MVKNNKLEDKIKHELKFLRRENKRLSTQILTEDDFIERTRDVISSIRPPRKYKQPELKQSDYTPQSMVILFSDCQIGEKVDLEETQLGEYNIEIFGERVKKYYDSIMSITNRYRKTTPINDAHIFMLGDMVEGERIFKGQGSRITDDLMVQFFKGKEIVSRFVGEISGQFKKVKINCVGGNHGRVFERKDAAKFYLNWDYMMYRYMKDTLNQHKNIEWNIPRSWWTTDEIQGQIFYMTHGDDLIRYMGIPWYSLERMDGRLAKMLQMNEVKYDHLVIGHHHQALFWDAGPGERIVNGAFSSANYYAAKKLHLMTKPKQLIFGVHPEHGITFRYMIDLEEKRKEKGDGRIL